MRMTDLKERRQRAIADLIRANALSSQEELAERLGALGFAVTQATISRDLEQIGAVKVRRDGQLSYALPETRPQRRACPRLAAVFRDWVRSVEPAGNLVVIKTPPGSAHLVGVALDQFATCPRSSARSAATTRSSSPAARPADAKALSSKLAAELA